METVKKKRIPQLEGLRFIMCCVIILSHFEFLGESPVFGEFYKTYLHNPTLAVDYFFMLSGFGIYLSSKRPECTIKGAFGFAVDKIRKIYPAYVFSLALGLPTAVYSFVQYGDGLGKIGLKLLAFLGIDLTLFQSIFGMTMLSQSINGVCWFLSSLFICYLLCPWILRMIDAVKSYNGIMVCIFIFICTIFVFSYGALNLENLFGGKLNDIWYGHPFIRVWYLTIGMCIGFVYKRKNIKNGTTIEFTVSLIAISYFFMRNSILIGSEIIRIFDVCLATVFLLVFATGEGIVSRILSKSQMIRLGSLSMLLFLFHYPIRKMVDIIWINCCTKCFEGEIFYLTQTLTVVICTILCVAAFDFYNEKVHKSIR